MFLPVISETHPGMIVSTLCAEIRSFVRQSQPVGKYFAVNEYSNGNLTCVETLISVNINGDTFLLLQVRS